MSDTKKRKYTFKNQAYWDNVRNNKRTPLEELANSKPIGQDFEPGLVSYASSTRASGGTETRRNKVSYAKISDDKGILSQLKLPYSTNRGKISMKDAIELCQKVYANIAIFRNTIDIMTEFSAADIYLTGGNAASRTFITNWMEKAGIPKFKNEYFREYFRSGNNFVVVFNGKYTEEDFKKLKVAYAVKKNQIPIRYTVLNPADVVIYAAASFHNVKYYKVLNQYELEQLREKKTEEDRIMYNALPEDVKRIIDNGNYGGEGVYIPIDPENLYTIFYKKQPYEPFAIPFGYPVLRDLNHKEELKQIDQAISRCIENALLLITMGDKKDQYGNGINKVAMEKMQELLSNESVSRVLVSDYTTKGEWLIPEIGEILNPIKYQVVNEDIREGLLNVMMGSDKFANAAMKTQIFLERLKEGREVFLNEFLQKEINKVCKMMNFKSIPRAKFQQIDLKDEVQFAKIFTRLIEIGVLTPEQGLKAIQTGIYPEERDMTEAQEKWTEERKKGLYNPLLGGVPMAISPDAEENRKMQKELGHAKISQQSQKGGASNPNSTSNGRPAGSTAPKSTNTVSPTGTSTASVKNPVSMKKFRTIFEAVSDLNNKAEASLKEKYGLTELNDTQKNAAFRLTQSVITSSTKEEWNDKLDEAIRDPESFLTKRVSNATTDGVDEVAVQHQIDSYSAALLYHSKWEA